MTLAGFWDATRQQGLTTAHQDYQQALMQPLYGQMTPQMPISPYLTSDNPPPNESYLGTNNTFPNCVINDGTLSEKIAKAKPGETIFVPPTPCPGYSHIPDTDKFTQLHNHDFHKLLDEFERLKNG